MISPSNITLSGMHENAPILRTCSELKSVGFKHNGVYMIDPDGPRRGVEPFLVYCDQFTDHGKCT